MTKKSVAVLGATGTVGQKVIAMLADHPKFEVKELVASESRVGMNFSDCCEWREQLPAPQWLRGMSLKSHTKVESTYVISSIPATHAKVIEVDLAKRGHHVLSNASAFRMGKDIPLIIPEINGAHIELVEEQKFAGKIVTNPNCSTVFLAMGLAPLLELSPFEEVSTFTMQAVSGAGYPGVASIDLIGNSIPYISNEEDKIESEAQKILGQVKQKANFPIMAHVNRVPVAHGHCVTFHVKTQEALTQAQVIEHYLAKAEENSALYKVHTDNFRPQVRLDLLHDDMRAHIGRIKVDTDRRCVGMLSMGHNLVRGAAGAAIANLELLDTYLEGRP
ncbi:aspartate-semialdehyde dehydrogenase [bacterium]|nr:aspartate-semialdehyde dehydrogenase [bacterium]